MAMPAFSARSPALGNEVFQTVNKTVSKPTPPEQISVGSSWLDLPIELGILWALRHQTASDSDPRLQVVAG